MKTPEDYWAEYSQPDIGIHTAYPQPRKITEANFKEAIRSAQRDAISSILKAKGDDFYELEKKYRNGE